MNKWKTDKSTLLPFWDVLGIPEEAWIALDAEHHSESPEKAGANRTWKKFLPGVPAC